jgi:hypothetical protein
MNILLIGPVAEPKTVNGIQTFNRVLASVLNEKHNLDVAIPVNQLFTGKIRTREVARLTGCGGPMGYPPFGGAWGCADMACRMQAIAERIGIRK